MKITHLEIDTAIEIIKAHLGWTDTRAAYVNKSNLEFILESTKSRFNSDARPLHKKASYLLTQIVKGHPLVDGNKRAAVILTDTFVGANGARIEAHDDEIFEQVTALAAGRLEENNISKWLEKRIRRIP